VSVWDWIYKYFEKPGKYVLRVYRNLPRDVRKSGIHLHPEVYASFIVFATILVTAVVIALGVFLFRAALYTVIPVITVIPFFTFLILVYLPAAIASNRAGGLEGELPYTASYLSMLVISGLSPYTAFERIVRASRIFVKSSELAQRFVLLVKIFGKDPLSAFATISERTPSVTARDLLMGFVTTVKAGGDVVDYLNKKARLLFSELLVSIKIIADRLGSLLEAYLALVLLTTIAFSTMYFVTVSLAAAVPFGISSETMALILYILLPFVSGAVMLFADALQYKEPVRDNKPYIVFTGISLPVLLFLAIFGYMIPALLPPTHPFVANPMVQFTRALLVFPMSYVNVPDFLESYIAISMAIIYSLIPSVIYTEIRFRKYKIISGITRFMRDLVEIRKTGFSIEKGIIELSRRDYGLFTPYLEKLALYINLGLPLSRVLNWILNKIPVWRGKMLLYMLADAIEVGGGTIDVLETLAWFAESVEALEEEKRKNLRTLLIVPYMGSILTAISIIVLAIFLGTQVTVSGAYKLAALTTLPAIVLNSFIMGLVAGKVSAGTIAAGFKHSLALVVTNLLVALLGGYIASGFMSIVT